MSPNMMDELWEDTIQRLLAAPTSSRLVVWFLGKGGIWGVARVIALAQWAGKSVMKLTVPCLALKSLVLGCTFLPRTVSKVLSLAIIQLIMLSACNTYYSQNLYRSACLKLCERDGQHCFQLRFWIIKSLNFGILINNLCVANLDRAQL